MKTVVIALLAIVAVLLNASAAPKLLLEATITEHAARGEKSVLSAPTLVVESGRQAIVQVGKLELGLTPTLLENGNVNLRATFADRSKTKADELVAPVAETKLGETAAFQVGSLGITIKTSLAK